MRDARGWYALSVAPHGYVTQWLPAYQVPAEATLATEIVATFAGSGATLAAATEHYPPLTDDHPVLEYALVAARPPAK